MTTQRPESQADLSVQRLVDALSSVAGESLGGVIFFGSRLTQTSPSAQSAADLFVIVRSYREFYRRLVQSGHATRGVRLLSNLNRWLPPNVILFRPHPDDAGAKCFVLSQSDFDHAVSSRSRDHFCRGRLSQQVAVIHPAAPEAREALRQCVQRARASAVEWVPLYLNAPFTVETFCRRMLEISYSSEIRPESPGRVAEVFSAQAAYWAAEYGPILQAAVERGELSRAGEYFTTTRNMGWATRWRWRWYFQQSRVRATLRWAKYVLTFEKWLDYIVNKVERRTGQTVQLTSAERKWPLLLLWPKALRVMRASRSRDDEQEASAK